MVVYDPLAGHVLERSLDRCCHDTCGLVIEVLKHYCRLSLMYGLPCSGIEALRSERTGAGCESTECPASTLNSPSGGPFTLGIFAFMENGVGVSSLQHF